jgi:hypothetical protein
MPDGDRRRVTQAESENKETTKHEKKPWFWRLAIFLTGAGLGALISLGLAQGLGGGQVQPFEAQQFLENYFTLAVKPISVEQSWQMLTPDFQQNLQGGREGFLKWYKKWNEIYLGEVLPSGNNLFTAKVTYIGNNDKSQIVGTGVFSLSCSNFVQSYDPFNSSCSVNSIRMNYYGLGSVLN